MAQPVAVPEGYRCPLCPTHDDDTFFHSNIVGAPICQGCTIDISMLIDQPERPDDVVLDRLEALTGLTFREYKKISLEQSIEDLERRLRPENLERESRTATVLGLSLKEFADGLKRLIQDYRDEIARL